MNILNVGCCFLILFLLLLEKEFYNNILVFFPSYHLYEKNEKSVGCFILNDEKSYFNNKKKIDILRRHRKLKEDTHTHKINTDKWNYNKNTSEGYLLDENNDDLNPKEKKYKKEKENYSYEREEKRDQGKDDNIDHNNKKCHYIKKEEASEEEKKIYDLMDEELKRNEEESREQKRDREIHENVKKRREQKKEEEEKEEENINKLIKEETGEKAGGEEEVERKKENTNEKVNENKNEQINENNNSILTCSNKLNYLELTPSRGQDNHLFSTDNHDCKSNIVNNIQMIDEKNEKLHNLNDNREEVRSGVGNISHIESEKKENKNNDKGLLFIEGYTQHKDQTLIIEKNKGNKMAFISPTNGDEKSPSDVSQNGIEMQKEEEGRIGTTRNSGNRGSSTGSSNYSTVSFSNLQIYDKMPENISNSYKIRNVHRHIHRPIYHAEINSSLKNNYSFIFLFLNTNDKVRMVPMNFLVQHSIVNLTDEQYDKLKGEKSVSIYDNNNPVKYQYETFEIKEDEANAFKDNYNDGNNNNNGGKNNKENESDSNKESEASTEENNKNAESKWSFDGTLVTYSIIILLVVILLSLTFIVYYYDLINKVKRLQKKRKNNKSLTIENDKSSDMYMDSSYGESTHV
ncbi:conserved Plasmodium protein, unknown function [Plasmodium malariae]|uniref:Uncharacterized protein n=1 Tax=Plasmodium malariae TaxID=5858 RepID=A0A1D3RJ29_PLAMA|nr:conserved Plasmodium protein, unknown function [Plasmodium malariae]SCN44966.1 conserved Plasmodium protein, unknown function [Plasmodium malariae]